MSKHTRHPRAIRREQRAMTRSRILLNNNHKRRPRTQLDAVATTGGKATVTTIVAGEVTDIHETRNCGECLMNDVEIVALNQDGVCPRCGTDYGPRE